MAAVACKWLKNGADCGNFQLRSSINWGAPMSNSTLPKYLDIREMARAVGGYRSSIK